MPLTFVILLGFVLAIVGAIVALTTRHKRAGMVVMIGGLVLAVGLSLMLVLSLQTM